MAASSDRSKWLIMAFVVPFVLHTGVILVWHLANPHDSSLNHKIWEGLMILDEVAGFVFLAKAFRMYAVPLAIGYFPAMYAGLFGFTFIVGALLGESL